MTDETAKILAEALNRFAAAIERLAGMGSLGGGIHIYHHGDQPSAAMNWSSENSSRNKS